MRALPIWILNGLLALAVFGLFQWPVVVPDTDPRAADTDLYADITPASRPALENYAVITERPLFNPDRRPAPPPPEPESPPDPEPEPAPREAKPEAPPKPPGGRLHGVIGDDSGWIVLYQEEGTDTIRRLKPSDRVQGWTIDEVQPHAIVFVRGDLRHSLRLRPAP